MSFAPPIYTPETPIRVYADHSDATIKNLPQLFVDAALQNTRVVVYSNGLIGGTSTVWFALENDDAPPNWRCVRPVPVQSFQSIDIKYRRPAQTVTRTYLDLELFIASNDCMGRLAPRLEVEMRAGMYDLCDGIDADRVEEYMKSNPGSFPTCVNVAKTRPAHNGHGYHIGYELYIARLPIVPASSNDRFHGPGEPTDLAKWLVCIDHMECELLDAPPEPEVVCGKRDPNGKFWSEGGLENAPEVLEQSQDWEDGYEVDGEFLTNDEFDAAYEGFYHRPDEDFVLEEMTNIIGRFVSDGARRVYNRDSHTWELTNAYGELL